MIQHIVLFKFNDQTTEEQKEEGARRLRNLIHVLPGILNIYAGQNYSTRGKGYSMALTVLFRSEEDHQNYTPSKEHQAVVSYMKQVGLIDSLAVDFKIESEQ